MNHFLGLYRCLWVIPVFTIGLQKGLGQSHTKKEVDTWLEMAIDLSANEPDSSLVYFEKAKKALSVSKKSWTRLRILYDLYYSSYLNELNNYDSSLYYVNRALKQTKGVDSLQKLEGLTYNYLGQLYQNSMHYEKALDCFLKSIAIYEAHNDPDLYFDYHNLANIYLDLGMDSLAIEAYKEADRRAPDDPYIKYSININLAYLYLQMDLPHVAGPIFKKIEPFFSNTEVGTRNNRFMGLVSYADYYVAVDSLLKAREVLDSAASLAKKLDIRQVDMFLSRSWSRYYKAKGDYAKAYGYITDYHALSDSLDGVEVRNSLNELQTKYATAEKERQIQAQELRLEKSSARQRILILSTGAILIILVLLAYFYMNSRKKRKLLYAQNLQIQKANREIENLMRESHHRIKNNLQVVSSLLKMQSKNVHSPEARASLIEAFNRVKTIALLHQKLQGSQTFKEVDLQEFVEQLVQASKDSLVGNQSQVALFTKAEKVEVSTDMAISIGLVINELITNAIKYAFSASEKGVVHIDLKVEKGSLHLRVSDTGKGFPADFKFEELNSLGFKIVRSMATKLKAQVKVSTNKGAVIDIEIPYERAA